ncbi:MAG: hypothetical protein ACTTJC_02170 [Campylobacter sp.]
MKYVYYNQETNEISGFYDDEIHQNIPKPNFQITDEIWQKAMSENATHVNIKTKELYREQKQINQEEILKIRCEEFLSNVDEILNQEARKKGYDSIVTAVSYAGYENSFQAEGIKFGKWRSQVYEWGYALLKEIESGKRSLPQSFEEIKNDMPKFK